MQHMYISCPRSPEEGVGSSRIGVTDICELAHEHREPTLGILQDQQCSPSLQPFRIVSEIIIDILPLSQKLKNISIVGNILVQFFNKTRRNYSKSS